MSDSDSPLTACPVCGAEAHESARFCAQCGARLEQADAEAVDDATRPSTVSAPAAFARANRHVFGLAPPELVLTGALVALLLGVYLLAVEHWIAGALLVALAAVLGRFFLWTTRRLPEQRVARLAAAVGTAASGRAEFARVSVSSWTSAGWQVLRLRQLQRRLEREQSELIRALGEAVFHDDTERAEQLKAEARACGEQIEQHAEELRLALEAARERVNRERAAIQPTEALTREQAEPFAPGVPQADK
jgi:hypothetical protein